MKELRFNAADGVWRVAFVFDPKRQAVLFVAGDKGGVSQKRFYRKLITIADKRFKKYLQNQKVDEPFPNYHFSAKLLTEAKKDNDFYLSLGNY